MKQHRMCMAALFVAGMTMVSAVPAQTPAFATPPHDPGAIRIGVVEGHPPFEYVDAEGSYTGLSAEVMGRVIDRLGARFVAVPARTHRERMDMLRHGEIDLVPAIMPTVQRGDRLVFTRSYLSLPIVVITLQEQNALTRMEDLRGRQVAVLEGHICQDLLKANYTDIRLVGYDRMEDALQAVSRGTVDAYVENSASAMHLLAKLGLEDLKVAFRTPFVYHPGIAVRKEFKPLRDQVDRVLAEISDADMDRIRERWIPSDLPDETAGFFRSRTLRILLAVMAGLVLLTGVVLLWNWSLQRENQERRKAERRLADVFELNQKLVAASSMGIAVYRDDGTCVMANPALARMLGAGPDDLVPRRFDLQPAWQATGLADDVRRALQTGWEQRREVSVTVTLGRTIWIDVSMVPFSSGGRKHFMLLATDVSDRKMFEEQLRRERDTAQHYLDIAGVMMVAVGGDQRVTLINRKGCEILGYSEVDILGQNWFQRFLSPDCAGSEREAFEREIRGEIEMVEFHESSVVTSRGDQRLMLWHNSILRNAQGSITAVLSSGEDITERKLSENELRRAKEEAEQLNRQLESAIDRANKMATAAEAANTAKSQFLANMSHEIRTPMNAILGFAELLGREIVSPRQKHQIDTIISSGKSLLNLLEDILDLSKIEAGKLILEPVPLDIARLIRDVARMFEFRVQEKNLTWKTLIDPQIPSHVLLDETRMRQVLINLIGNAVKFTNQGGVEVQAVVGPGADASRVDLVFTVTDTGIGIPLEDQERIFEAFEQQSGQSTRQYGGTGLGLAITRRLVTIMGGRIGVQSAPGQGSVFSVSLPGVTVVSEPPSAPAVWIPENLTIVFEPATVLLIESNATHRRLVRDYLQDTGLSFQEAASGEEGLALIQHQWPDVIMMGIVMPGMDGWRVARAIRDLEERQKKDCAIPLLIVSATSEAGHEKDMRALHIKRFIKKPVQRSMLLGSLMNILPHREPVFVNDRSVERRSCLEMNLTPAVRAQLLAALPALEGEWRDTGQKAARHLDMAAVDKWCTHLRELGLAQGIPPLVRFAEDLQQAVDVFDVQAIQRAMQNYNVLLEDLRRCLEAQGKDSEGGGHG